MKDYYYLPTYLTAAAAARSVMLQEQNDKDPAR